MKKVSIWNIMIRNKTCDYEYTYLFIRTYENYANDLLRVKGVITVDEIYDILEIPLTTKERLELKKYGWNLEDERSDKFVDFGLSMYSLDDLNVAEKLYFNCIRLEP